MVEHRDNKHEQDKCTDKKKKGEESILKGVSV